MSEKDKDEPSISDDPWEEIFKLDHTSEGWFVRMGRMLETVKKHSSLPVKTIDSAFLGPNPQSQKKVIEWLRAELSALRCDEKKPGSAPVVTGKHIGRAAISDMAMTILEHNDSIEPALWCLLAELLDVDRHRSEGQRAKLEIRKKCMFFEAQLPQLGTRELARKLHVAPSTVSAWRNDPTYQETVSSLRDHFKKHPVKPPDK